MGRVEYSFANANSELVRGTASSATPASSELQIASGETNLDVLLNEVPTICTTIDASFTLDTDWIDGRRHGVLVMCNNDMTTGYFVHWDDRVDYAIEIYRRDAVGSPYTNTILARSPLKARTYDGDWRIKASPQGDGVLIQVFAQGDIGWVCVANASDDAYTSGRMGVSVANNTADGVLSDLVARYETIVEISTPSPYQVFQRASGVANIPVSGIYRGNWDGYQARWNGGTWQNLTDTGSGTFSGTLSSQAEGQGTLEIRNTAGTIVQQSAYVGVGDVYIVMGQSNAAGEFTNFQEYTYEALRASQYRFYGDKWGNLADPTGANTVRGSVWPRLADHLMAGTGVPVAFICTGVGGTTLVVEPTGWSPGDAQYERAVEMVEESGINGAKAALWYQGETDAFRGSADAAEYAAALSGMIDQFQSDTGLTGLPFVAALIGEVFTTDAADVDAIRDGIVFAWNTDSDVLAGPPAHDRNFSDGVHWTTDPECQILADRWYRCLKAHFFSGADSARAYIGNTATRTGTTIEVVFINGAGSIQNASDITGWEYSGANITAGVATGTSTIELTIDADAPGTLKWLSGNRTATATLSDTGVITDFPPDPVLAILT